MSFKLSPLEDSYWLLTASLIFTTANQPPRLNGSEVFMVTRGQASVYRFMATDTDEFTVTHQGDLPNTLVNSTSGMYSFTVNDSAVTNTTVSFVAKDSLNASSLLNPQVLVCACQNGNCTLEGVLNRDADPLIMNCVCPEGTYKIALFYHTMICGCIWCLSH